MFRWTSIVIALLPLGLSAATDQPPDTLITLRETEVRAMRYNAFSAGHSFHQIDDLFIHNQYDRGIDQLLTSHTGMFIKRYGPGILSTSSLRGGSAAQTSLIWNGFPLQNYMHGQTDLALFPVFFADEAGIQYGGGSALWGSGNMGGSIHLNNTRDMQQGWSALAGVSAVDVGEMAQHFRLAWGSETVSSRLRFFNRTSDNLYSYRNTAMSGHPVQIQEHAALYQRGLLHETYISMHNRHRLNIRWWWQETNRNIPPPLMQSTAGAYQEDGAFRITGQWQTTLDKSVISWRGGLFDETLLYFDSLSGESRSRSQTIIQEAGAVFSPHPSLLANGGINTSRVKARADEYRETEQKQQSLALFGSLKWKAVPGRLQLLTSVRQEFVDSHAAPLAPAFGLSFQAMPMLFIKANTGKNYRVPTLNDKYWTPGGNPDLEPEKGWSRDLTIAFDNPEQHRQSSDNTNDPGSPVRLQKASITGFHRNISQWIIWLPLEGMMHWSPRNVMEVRSYGLEARVAVKASAGAIQIGINARWDLTLAENMRAKSPNDASTGKQLIYVPKNTAGYSWYIRHERLTLIFDHSYTGKRYTSSDNNQWLNPYHTGNIGLQWQYNVAGHSFRVYAAANNLWNEAYEAMAGRPMPLRHFQAGIQLEIFAQQKRK